MMVFRFFIIVCFSIPLFAQGSNLLNNSSENPLTPCVYGGQTACHDFSKNHSRKPFVS